MDDLKRRLSIQKIKCSDAKVQLLRRLSQVPENLSLIKRKSKEGYEDLKAKMRNTIVDPLAISPVPQMISKTQSAPPKMVSDSKLLKKYRCSLLKIAD